MNKVGNNGWIPAWSCWSLSQNWQVAELDLCITSKGWKIFSEMDLGMDSHQPQDTKHEFHPPKHMFKGVNDSETPPEGQCWFTWCFETAVCFGRQRGGRPPPPDFPLSGTELHYLCRSGSKHPTETARSEDSEMRRRVRDERRWRAPRLIPLVPVKTFWLEAQPVMSAHGEADGWRKKESVKRKNSRGRVP